ncbi:MAG: MerR family transcriptional regulator [Planctomycetaceae bacterium]
MASRALLPIGLVSLRSGVSIETIRAWERRYQVLTPERDGRGRRLYRREEVERLRLLKRASDLGHSIGDIHALSGPRLEALLASRRPPESGGALPMHRILAAGSSLDARGVEEGLAEAAANLPPRRLVLDLLGPLLVAGQARLSPAPLSLVRHWVWVHALARLRLLPHGGGPVILLVESCPGDLALPALLARAQGLLPLPLSAQAGAEALGEAAVAAAAAIALFPAAPGGLERLLPPQVEAWALGGDPLPASVERIEGLGELDAALAGRWGPLR